MQGKVVVITGGAGVLGSALAKGAAELGAKVAILSRTVEKVKKLVGDIQASGGQALALVGDVLDQSSIESACQTALREWHKVDVLINCAGGNLSLIHI